MQFRANQHYFYVASPWVQEQLCRLISCDLYYEKGEMFYDGYVFLNSGLYHHRHTTPAYEEVWKTYATNCGVFVYAVARGETIEIVTDPLAQYPLFYWSSNGQFLVSNNFWLFSCLLCRGVEMVDEDVIADYIAYQSPLAGKTLIRGVRRLQAYTTLTIASGDIREVSQRSFEATGSYETLKSLIAQRLTHRASSLIRLKTPVLQLTGGADSRLALAALMASDGEFKVACYGDGLSQDRLLFESLVERYGLEKGQIRWYHSRKDTADAQVQAVVQFNALKSNNYLNFAPIDDPDYAEVNGYFGGLLKPPVLAYQDGTFKDVYNYAKSVSSFEPDVFNHVQLKIEEEFARINSRVPFGNRSLNALLWVDNRAAAHFGQHSVVNNRSYYGIDILYDPLLLSLQDACEYSEEDIFSGVVIVDLIEEVYSPQLAYWPYDRRVMPVYKAIDQAILKELPYNCFSGYRFPNRQLAPMEVCKCSESKTHSITEERDLRRYTGRFYSLWATSQLFERNQFLKGAIRTPTTKRHIELESLSNVCLALTVLDYLCHSSVGIADLI